MDTNGIIFDKSYSKAILLCITNKFYLYYFSCEFIIHLIYAQKSSQDINYLTYLHSLMKSSVEGCASRIYSVKVQWYIIGCIKS